ncbi:MAG: patatin-like phospholipase family protein [Bacteroidota bacterium]
MFKRLLYRTWIRRIVFFFPVQLLLVALKKNHLHLLFWLILFGFVTQKLAAKYGVPFLFLYPEYLNKVSFLSYALVGFSCGGFIMAFHIASYVMNGFRFPFLATLYNPFWKYCVNNSILPLLFVIVYVVQIKKALVAENIYTSGDIFLLITGFLTGMLLFVFLGMSYFFTTNKDIYKLFGVRTQDPRGNPLPPPRKIRTEEWKNPNLVKETRDWYTETYIGSYFRLRLVRPVRHYKKEMLRRVFRQNHHNAGKFGVVAIGSLIILGLFQDYDVFMIPAGASVFLLFTTFLMISSALYSFFRGWANTVLIVTVVVLNFVFRSDFLGNTNKAYGLNYDADKADYSYATLKRLYNDRNAYSADTSHAISILEKWKYNNLNFDLRSSPKPKMVIINTSGGGLRSSLWTFHVLQYCDSLLKGKLFRHTHLISGSSGGMIGAAYYRELYLLKQNSPGLDLFHPGYAINISNDILNPVAFSIATNELFFGLQKFEDGNHTYPKDRAYAFERQLNENTSNILDKRLGDYSIPEEDADIPLMIFAPSVVNDGRKLIISSQPVSFLAQNEDGSAISDMKLIEAIEFTRFFENQDAMNVKFTSVLRMNATFPYISPVVSLPSEPAIEVMDAGMRDNYGFETSLKYIYTFRKWLEKNTSGIIIIQIRDKHKERPIEPYRGKTLAQSLARPLGSFYGNLFSVQDFNHSQMLNCASSWFNGNIDVLDFQLHNEIPDNISLSWHLTYYEKQKVLNSLLLKENQESLKRLLELLH